MEKVDVYEELKELIGPDAAKRLVDRYAGSSLYIPQCAAIRKHRQIREEFSNGSNYHELSLRHGYTERRVRQIVHAKKK